MKTNVRVKKVKLPLSVDSEAVTYEGGPASVISAERQLHRMTAAAMLFEDQFYVDGKSSADLVRSLVPLCRAEFVAALAYDARTNLKLRHMPLLLVREMARGPKEHKALVGKLLPDVIQRPDEITEFLAIYWKDKANAPISAQVKKGLAKSFAKFNEYALAKYNRKDAIQLRDVVFLTHPKPEDAGQADLMARLVNKDKIPTHTKGGHQIGGGFERTEPTPNAGLKTPDTWEVALSAGKGEGKREAWERLLVEKKLGALAFLRNLRNMTEAGVTKTSLELYASTLDVARVLPFRFVAASRAAPQLEPLLEALMLKALKDQTKLAGRTVLLVDISGSMQGPISKKSDLNRLDAAAALAMLLREVCQEVVVGRFDTHTELVPPRRGFALRDAIGTPRGGTDIGQAVRWANAARPDRIVVFTDEQSATTVGAPNAGVRGYIINVAAYQHGVGYDSWMHVSGFSESVLDFIRVVEAG